MNNNLSELDNQDLNINLLSYRDEDIYDMEQEDEINRDFKRDNISYQSYISSDSNYQSPFREKGINNCAEIPIKQKQQPFISTFMKKKLQDLLTKDGFSQQKEISDNLTHLILKSFSKKFKKDVIIKVIRCTFEDYEMIKERIEKIIAIDTLQFIQKYYQVLYYSDLFLSVIIQETYKQTLSQEIVQNQTKLSDQQKNLLFFQLSHSLTEIHSYNLVHYLITPQNIIKSNDGNYKLSGFEEMIRLKNRQNIDNEEEKYLSPESIQYINDQKSRFDKVNCKTDVYSIGIIIKDLLKEPIYNFQSSIFQSSPQSNDLQKSNQDQISQLRKKDFSIQSGCNNQIEGFNNINIVLSTQNENQNVYLYQGSLKRISQKEQFYEELLNPNQLQRLNSYKIFIKLSQFLYLDQSYLHQMLSSIYRSLKVDIFFRNKQQIYLKQLRYNYSELRLQLTLLLPNQQPETIFNAYKCSTLHHIFNGEYQKGLDYAQSSLYILKQKCNQNIKEMINLLIIISLCYERLKKFKESLDYSLEAYQLVNKQEDYDYLLLGRSSCRLSWSYCRLREGDKALQFGEESFKAYQKLNQKKCILNLAEALDSIGCANEILQFYDQALQKYQQSLEFRLQKYNSAHPVIAQSYFNIGLVYQLQNNNQHSLENFLKSAKIYKQYKGKYKQQLLQSYTSAYNVSLQLNDTNQAEQIKTELNQISSQPTL